MSYRLTVGGNAFKRTASVPNAPITACGWVYLAQITTPYNRNHTYWSIDEGGFAQYLAAGTYGDATQWEGFSSSGGLMDTSGAAPLTAGVWQFIAITAVAGSPAQLYWGPSGALSAQASASNFTAFSPVPATLRFGSVDDAGTEFLFGGVYNWKVWSGGTVLTGAQLATERDAYAPVITANLWAHYPFLAADASAGNDLSANARHLTIVTSLTGAATENGGANPTGAPAPTAGLTYELEGYRWRHDDGSETTATWIAAQDTAL